MEFFACKIKSTFNDEKISLATPGHCQLTSIDQEYDLLHLKIKRERYFDMTEQQSIQNITHKVIT